MFSSKLFTSAAFFAAVLAVPTELVPRTTSIGATVNVCENLDNPTNCVAIPIVSDQCIDFSGGLSFLDNGVSSATVPDGFVCTFFDQPNCADGDAVVLTPGSWNFFNVPGPSGSVNFNDMASSVSCSPV
ncbi:hypothetical protein BDZ97DRAFT_2065872 [Flammula alnicola]|nr:hypothetical protein BDZ97DRAFT_2065872 [Flammula alnicola]